MFNRQKLWLSAIATPVLGLTIASSATALDPLSVSASADDGNLPEYTLDKDLGTRWSAQGDGQWITYDLGALTSLDSIGIAFYKGDARQTYFSVYLSDDNASWNLIVDTVSSGQSTEPESFNLGSAYARYVKIVGGGNTSNDWNSLTEVEFVEAESGGSDPGDGEPEPTPELLEVSAVSASDHDGNVPENTIDGHLSTRWSANGSDAWIEYDLGQESTLTELLLAFYKGDQRTATFDVTVSNDRNNWFTAWSGVQPVSTTDLQPIDIAEVDSRYLRIVGYGNSANSWNSITEVELVGIHNDGGSGSSGGSSSSSSSSSSGSGSGNSTSSSSSSSGGSASSSSSGGSSGGGLPHSELNSVPEIHCTQYVSTPSELEAATGWNMTAGTTVCLTDGTYNDVELSMGGIGSESAPITVAAQNPGKVIFGGEAQVRMGGEYLVLQGITFKNGNSSSSDLIQTRGSGSAPCHHCRMTELAIIDWDHGFDGSNKWLNIYGTNNRIDHSWFSGKINRGPLLLINREESDADPDRAQIDHNYFGNRPPLDGKEFPDASDNELEAVRIGDSATHTISSYSRVEYNYFEDIQGEAEIISNKAGHNVIQHNTIRHSYGSITTRHGTSATIAHNFIFGDGYPLSAGIRIVDDGHVVVNNYIEDCNFANTTHHGGIVMMGADGNDTNGYQQFENVMIAHNTIVDCVNSLNIDGGKKSRNPESVTLVNNVIANAVGPVLVQSTDGMPVDSVIDGNYFHGEAYSDSDLSNVNGITFVDVQLSRDSSGVYRPSSNSPAVDGGVYSFATQENFPFIDVDMDGQPRDSLPDAGADETSSAAITIRPLTGDDVGPMNYRP
ncbi:discoidin domain-containing protein [Microbulbifer elongatus]|uniref:Discoidin domain-containing protein n=1 Tax=Microbulbifer elongatus TaxID=86173 RepID=A0ABT1P1J0_9GAMM|nr:chondroitinase-B domain-containing protein [Microbulbifer elongatus]MCQ3829991.1 discoidin domain-containing protein [Microbulbifer elongatus]